jgi:hypothetical protein
LRKAIASKQANYEYKHPFFHTIHDVKFKM